MDISIILAAYPKYYEWAELIKRRINTLQAYRVDRIRSGSGGHADSVGHTVALLLDSNALMQRVEICRQFVESLDNQRERAILLGVWRTVPWRVIAEGLGIGICEVVALWREMLERLRILFAGSVCGRDGGAYARCLSDCRQGQEEE